MKKVISYNYGIFINYVTSSVSLPFLSFLVKLVLFWPKIHFFWLPFLKKETYKTLGNIFPNFLSKTESGLLGPKIANSSLKKRSSIFLANWLNFILLKHCQIFLVKVNFLLEWSWKPETANFLSLKWGILRYVMWLYCTGDNADQNWGRYLILGT